MVVGDCRGVIFWSDIIFLVLGIVLFSKADYLAIFLIGQQVVDRLL